MNIFGRISSDHILKSHLGTTCSWLLVVLAWVAVIPGAAAAEDKPRGHVMRILAVGNRAPFRQEVREGVRYEVDPPEGSLPPAEIHTVFSGGDGQDSSKSTVRLRMGEVSPPLRFPVPETGRIQLHDSGNQTWLEPALSPGAATLVVAWKTGAKWNEVGSLSLDDSETAIPQGACRIVNASNVQIGVVFGKSKYRLLPGKAAILSFEVGLSTATMEILYATSDTALKPVLRTSVSRDAGIRRQWIVHRADQPGARQPIGVIPIFEPRQPGLLTMEDRATNPEGRF